MRSVSAARQQGGVRHESAYSHHALVFRLLQKGVNPAIVASHRAQAAHVPHLQASNASAHIPILSEIAVSENMSVVEIRHMVSLWMYSPKLWNPKNLRPSFNVT